jgi:hypothetical protein
MKRKQQRIAMITPNWKSLNGYMHKTVSGLNWLMLSQPHLLDNWQYRWKQFKKNHVAIGSIQIMNENVRNIQWKMRLILFSVWFLDP